MKNITRRFFGDFRTPNPMTVVHISKPPGRNRRTASSVIRFCMAQTVVNSAAIFQLERMLP